MNIFGEIWCKYNKLPLWCRVLIAGCIAFGSVIRYVNLFNLGFTFDMVATQYQWGKNGFEMGYFSFWRDYKGFFDYTSLSLLFEILVYWISLIGGGSAQAFVTTLKLVNWLVDILFCYGVWRVVDSQNFLDESHQKKLYACLALLYASPVLWFISAVWGQNDTLIVLGGLIAIYLARHKQYWRSALVFTITFWIKQQVILIIPTLAIVILTQQHSEQTFSKKVYLKVYLRIVAVYVLVFLGISLFLYTPLAFLDLNRAGNSAFAAFLREDRIGFGASTFWTLVNIAGKGSQPLFFLTVTIWGYIIFLLCTVFVGHLMVQKKQQITWLDLSVFTTVCTSSYFLFVTKMHSRYLHFGVLWACISLVFLLKNNLQKDATQRIQVVQWITGMVVMFTGYTLNQIGSFAVTSVWGFDNPDPSWVRWVFYQFPVDVGWLAALLNSIGFCILFWTGKSIIKKTQLEKIV